MFYRQESKNVGLSLWRNGAGEMAQKLRVCASLAGDLSLVPNTHMVVHKSSSRESDALLWPLWVADMYMVHEYAYR